MSCFGERNVLSVVFATLLIVSACASQAHQQPAPQQSIPSRAKVPSIAAETKPPASQSTNTPTNKNMQIAFVLAKVKRMKHPTNPDAQVIRLDL